jgi:hypothetical protein
MAIAMLPDRTGAGGTVCTSQHVRRLGGPTPALRVITLAVVELLMHESPAPSAPPAAWALRASEHGGPGEEVRYTWQRWSAGSATSAGDPAMARGL